MAQTLYAKVIDGNTKSCDVGLGTNDEYYKSIGMTPMEVEQAYNGNWYLAGCAPQKPHDLDIKDQIIELENQVTDRNIRGALLGDEFAINKITQIEAQIEDLRRQLDEMEAQQ